MTSKSVFRGVGAMVAVLALAGCAAAETSTELVAAGEDQNLTAEQKRTLRARLYGMDLPPRR